VSERECESGEEKGTMIAENLALLVKKKLQLDSIYPTQELSLPSDDAMCGKWEEVRMYMLAPLELAYNDNRERRHVLNTGSVNGWRPR
jgi:hypothetical protein